MDMESLSYIFSLNLFEGGFSTNMICEEVYLGFCPSKEAVLTHVGNSLYFSLLTRTWKFFTAIEKYL